MARISNEQLLLIFRAIYSDLQNFEHDNENDDDDDDQQSTIDDFDSQEINQAIANSIETMPEFSFAVDPTLPEVEFESHTVFSIEESEEICPICKDALGQASTAVTTKCNHTFHKECIETWAKSVQKCPICRTNFQ